MDSHYLYTPKLHWSALLYLSILDMVFDANYWAGLPLYPPSKS